MRYLAIYYLQIIRETNCFLISSTASACQTHFFAVRSWSMSVFHSLLLPPLRRLSLDTLQEGTRLQEQLHQLQTKPRGSPSSFALTHPCAGLLSSYFDILVLFEGCGLSVVQAVKINIKISSLFSQKYTDKYMVTLSIKPMPARKATAIIYKILSLLAHPKEPICDIFACWLYLRFSI